MKLKIIKENILKFSIDNHFSISTNPATDFIEISVSNLIQSEAKKPELKIYNVFGQEVNLTPPLTIRGEGERIDVSSLPPGVYFVRVGGRVGKFIKI